MAVVERYRFDGWVLDIPRRELRTDAGGICELTTAEFNLLAVFVRHGQRPLTRDQLMDMTKGHDWMPLDRSIDNQVARLRKKLATGAAGEAIIKTVRGVGYVFTAEVTAA